MQTNRQLFLKYLGQTSPSPMLLEIEKAEGVWLFTKDGTKYIDLISGVSVSNTGHRHPAVIKALTDQADMYLHLMVYGEYVQSPQVLYAEKICSLLPGNLHSCYFVNSGSEAIEGAMKLAKRYTGRSRIISFVNAYHGSTHGALSIQGSEVYKAAFRPLLPDTVTIPFNDTASLSLINKETACVIVEPVQAEAGVIYPANGFLDALRKRCDETGALLVFDESQTGFGRLGSPFASTLFNITPDIIVLAKALGGGMPLGAFISRNEIMSTLSFEPVLGHITTFGGHPVCCATGLASLGVILNEKLSESVPAKSSLFKRLLKHPSIIEIRGEGLMLALETGDAERVKWIVANAPRFGIVVDFFLFCSTAIRIAPPLTITDDEIRFACSQLTSLLDEMILKGI